MIPFQVANIIGLKQGGDAVIKVGDDLLALEVEHHLLASKQLVFRPQDPIGMGAKEVAVRVHHFRLNPKTELHVQGCDVINQRTQTVGIFTRINLPIAQGRAVIIATTKPSII